MKCFDDTVYKGKPVTYTASSETDDVASKFVEMLEKDITEIYDGTKFPKKMVITDEDKKKYINEKVCHICKESLGNDKVRDHCHLTVKCSQQLQHKISNSQILPYHFPQFIWVRLSFIH